jgi:hypothetical protein
MSSGRFGEELAGVAVDGGGLGHQQEGRPPAGGFHPEVVQHAPVLGGVAESALDRDGGFVGGDGIRHLPSLLAVVAGHHSGEFLLQAMALATEFVQDGPEQFAVGGEGVPAAVEPGLDAEFADFQALLGQEPALGQGRAEVGDLDHHPQTGLLSALAVEAGEFLHGPVQRGIDPRGEDQVPRIDRTGRTPPGRAWRRKAALPPGCRRDGRRGGPAWS